MPVEGHKVLPESGDYSPQMARPPLLKLLQTLREILATCLKVNLPTAHVHSGFITVGILTSIVLQYFDIMCYSDPARYGSYTVLYTFCCILDI